ncbi:nucleolar protein 6 [Centruroides vittatus]|uniref:nucleolar protein 6 n=1 Tax=Centruroides vittatus TaxID=120091 RepID=UPI00350F886F
MNDSNFSSDSEVAEDAKNVENQQQKRKQPDSVVSRKKRKDDKEKLPTAEELNNLKETETLFHSSLFRMQIDELLKEIKIKTKWKIEMDEWLEKLKSILTQLPESETYQITDQSWIKKIKVPIIQKPDSDKGIFKFLPPSDIRIIGSYPLDLLCLPNATVDIAIEIPKGCWQKCDYLNHRYHRKRSLYLVYIASQLRKIDFIEEMKFSYHCDDHMKPALILVPKGKLGTKLKVKLLPYPSKEHFRIIRFIPKTNNVRNSWFFEDKSIEEQTPTPHYNSSVLMDLLMVDIMQYLSQKLKDNQNLKDGILLLKVWLHQRNINQGYGGFSNFIITMLVCYLLTNQKINMLVSSYQLVRNVLLYLSDNNMLEKGISLEKNTDIKVFSEVYHVTFLDFSGNLNFCSWMTKEILKRVQHEAKLSLSALDSCMSDSFDTLFMKPIDFYQKFDHILHIKTHDLNKTINHLQLQNEILDYGGNSIAAVIPHFEELINRSCKNRIALLDKILWKPKEWKVTVSPPSPNNVNVVTFGILLNPENYNKTVERGPCADLPEAKEFRDFWGEKSELRRFQDGVICEAVVWPGKSFSERQRILYHIIAHTLKMHAHVDETSIHYLSNQLDSVLMHRCAPVFEDSIPYRTGEEINLDLLLKYNELSKELRKLKDIPLTVSSVQGMSAALRYCEIFPPIPHQPHIDNRIVGSLGNSLILKENATMAPQWVQPMEVLLHMETSGKWPDDIDAIRRTKAAFYIKLAEMLKSQFMLISVPFTEYVDVLKDGYVFRLSIACHKEINLLKQTINAQGMIKYENNEESQKLERKIVHLPKLSSYIYGLQQQNNIYGSACRLAKRWICSQLLSDFISDSCVELLMAYIYLSPFPFSTPNCPQVAFLRFLHLLHTYDWKSSALIVNFNQELKGEECSEIQSKFTLNRSTLPAMVIATPFDKDGITWTKPSPNAIILHHLIKLSKNAYETLHDHFINCEPCDTKQIFRPPIGLYDIIIHLNPYYVPKYYQAIDITSKFNPPVYKKYKYVNNEKMPIVNFDPVLCYLKELRACFEEIALFFYDHCGGDAIYVLWKPKAFEAQDIKVSHLNCRKIREMQPPKVILNVEAIIEDFGILGSGLVNFVETKADKWKIS